MTFFVCRIDGTQVGEFEEEEFRDKVFARQIKAEDYYWHDGMSDWRPVSEYRALAKTQRISFAPPPARPTVKIDVAQTPPPPKPTNPITRWIERIRKRD